MGNMVIFKEWIQEQMKTDIIPMLLEKGYKKGRTNWFIREQDNIVQFIQFQIRQEKVSIWGGISPVYFPFDGKAYYGVSFMPDEQWVYHRGVTGKAVINQGMHWIITPEGIKKWNEAKRILQASILPQLDQMHNLDELLTKPSSFTSCASTWKGLKLYVEGVNQCLSKDFIKGVEKLKEAQLCKTDYLTYLKDIGSEFGIKGDQTSAIYNYIDMFCDGLSGENCTQKNFIEIYEHVCENSRKWYKIKR